MANGRLAKDVQNLSRNIDNYFDGQAKIKEIDDNLQWLTLDILPNAGFYKGAKIEFKVCGFFKRI